MGILAGILGGARAEEKAAQPLDPFTERFPRRMFFSCAASRPSIT